MVYLAAGVSGFTGIIESFFVKDELGLSAAFLASLGFWAGLPWALKMPIGPPRGSLLAAQVVFRVFRRAADGRQPSDHVGLTGYKGEMARLLPPDIW